MTSYRTVPARKLTIGDVIRERGPITGVESRRHTGHFGRRDVVGAPTGAMTVLFIHIQIPPHTELAVFPDRPFEIETPDPDSDDD